MPWIKDIWASSDVPNGSTHHTWFKSPFEIALSPLDDCQKDYLRTFRFLFCIIDESKPVYAFKYLKLYLTYHTDSEILLWQNKFDRERTFTSDGAIQNKKNAQNSCDVSSDQSELQHTGDGNTPQPYIIVLNLLSYIRQK